MSSNTPTASGSAASQTPYNITLPPITLQPASQPPPPPPSLSSVAVPSTSESYYAQAASSAQYSAAHLSPLEDGREFPGGKQKKEIKRRTKTGCLTCRARRIKCDETKPTCRNCEKSRRECRGYDPLFVPQKPVSLQPAPAPPQPHTQAPAPPPSKPPSPTLAHSLPALPTLRQPSQYLPPLSSSSTSSPAPSLPPVSHVYKQPSPVANGYPAAVSRQLPQPLEPAITYEKQNPPQRSLSTMASAGAAHRSRFKPVNIDDLFAIDGTQPAEFVPPLSSSSRVTDTTLNEIKILYYKDYSRGMNAFFETTWYTNKSWDLLLTDKDLLEHLAFLVTLMARTKTEDLKGQNAIKSLEAKLTWRLICLCRLPAAGAEVSAPLEASPGTPLSADVVQVIELRKRLDMFEHAITNRFTSGNVMATIPYTSRDTTPAQKKYEIDFFHLVGEFVAIDPDRANAQADADNCLAAIRALLVQVENRDIIYSILVARHLGGKNTQFPVHFTGAYNNDEKDERTKLFVAKRFIEDESLGATHQVMQRICNMAINSWTSGLR